MSKGYVIGWKNRKSPEAHIMDIGFDSDIQKAYSWPLKQDAEDMCRFLDERPIRIPTEPFGSYSCEGFTVEERSPDVFVIYCEAPFVKKAASV